MLITLFWLITKFIEQLPYVIKSFLVNKGLDKDSNLRTTILFGFDGAEITCIDILLIRDIVRLQHLLLSQYRKQLISSNSHIIQST